MLIEALSVYAALGAITVLGFHVGVERTLGVDPLSPCGRCRDIRRKLTDLLDEIPIMTPGVWGFVLFLFGVVWPLSAFIAGDLLLRVCRPQE